MTPGWRIPAGQSYFAALLALAAGLVLPLGFAPFSLHVVPFVSFALLFFLWRDASRRRAVLLGYLFALGMFSSGVSWVYVSLHDFGNMAAPLAILAVALFVALLALFGALAGWLQSVCASRGGGWHLLAVMPASWLLGEWLRAWILTGFPWLSVGFGQLDWPGAGYAAVFGVHGVSLVVLLLSSALVYLLLPGKKGKLFLLAAACCLLLAGWGFDRRVWTEPDGAPFSATLVQGDVAIMDKWREDKRQSIINRYLSLSETNPPSELIVWPEAALPEYLNRLDENFWQRLRKINARGSSILTGVVEYSRGQYYNSAVLIPAAQYADTAEQARAARVYRKSHLVPFGDYFPLPGFLRWILDYLHIPMSDFSAWHKAQPPMRIGNHLAEVSICYEDSFGAETIRHLPSAGLLINVSEDGWFGRSIGPLQRVEMARMLAKETGRPMLRAANTGVTAFIGPDGRVLSRLPQFRPGVLSGSVQAMAGTTPYVRWGNWPVVILSVLMLIAGYFGCRRGRFS